MNTLIMLQKELHAAAARVGDRSIGQRVRAGRFQVVRVTFGTCGKSTVEPLSDWANLEIHVQNIRSLQPE